MDGAMVESDIRFERVTGNAGAVVHGVGLVNSTSEAVAQTLRRALHEHGVLFFEFGRYLERSEFFAFGRLFGEMIENYDVRPKDMTERPDYIDSALTPMKQFRVDHWHADGTAFENPPQAGMLTPVELPEAGGDTMWASMYAAWDGLSSYYQTLLEGLEAVHSTVRIPFLEHTPTAIHPAVIRDPVTGRKILYVNSNWTERFVGMSEAESDALLRMLFAHINTPEFHVRRPWRPGVVAVYDERVTQHRGVADFTGPRKMRIVHFHGERPSR